MKSSRKRIAVGRRAWPIRTVLAVAFSALLLSWNIPVSASSKAGDLDPSFGGDGKVTTYLSSIGGAVTAIAVQPDGKVVAAGTIEERAFALARYNPDGFPDLTFGFIGVVITEVGGIGIIFSMSLLPDGKIVVAGVGVSTPNGFDFAVARYNPDGTLDTTFGSGGIVLTDFFGDSDSAYALTVLDDGKMIVTGTTWNPTSNNRDFGLVRYNSDGSLDESFGDGGRVVTDISGSDYAYGIGIQSSGKIVVGGSSSGTGSNFALARYKRDGKLDRSFGTDGKVITDFSGGYDRAYSLKIQPDDKIVLGGYAEIEEGGWYQGFALARYDANGTLDPTFGGGGKVTTIYSSFSCTVTALAIQADGKIVAAGQRRELADTEDFAVTRYDTDGSLDGSFSSGGMAITDFFNYQDQAWAVTIAPDGRIIVGGMARDSHDTYYFAVACYLAKGTPNITSAVVSGKKLFVYGTYFDEGSDIYLDGEKQKTKNDSDNPETVLIGKKAGKKIAPGQTVTLQVRCPDGRESREYSFTRLVE